MNFKKCIITDAVCCDKCVIVASALFKQLVFAAQDEQHLVYQLSSGNKSTKHIIYTNTYNIVIDLVFRMTYKIDKLFKALKSYHHVENIILINDLSVKYATITEELYQQKADNMMIQDHKTNNKFKRRFFVNLIVKAFKKWCLYYDVNEEEDYDTVEQSLATNYPDFYDFDMKTYRINYIIDTLSSKTYKENKRHALINFIQRITDVQTVLTPKMIDKCCEFVLWNLEHQHIKHLKIITTHTTKINENLIFSLFPSENVIYITKTFINSKYAFFIHDFQLCYPYAIDKQLNTIIIDEDTNKLIQMIVNYDEKINKVINRHNKLKKGGRISSFSKLLMTCQNDSVCGSVFDINANYRYTVFENVKSLIVDKLIETEFPSYMEDNEIVWISLNDYMEQLPEWIAQFNHFSHIKF